MVRDLRRPAYRAEVNCVMPADLRFPIVGHHLAVFFVVIPRRKIEVIELQRNVEFFGSGFEHANAFRHHFFTNAVTGDHCDSVGHDVVFIWCKNYVLAVYRARLSCARAYDRFC